MVKWFGAASDKRAVLARREIEKRRSPLVKVSLVAADHTGRSRGWGYRLDSGACR